MRESVRLIRAALTAKGYTPIRALQASRTSDSDTLTWYTRVGANTVDVVLLQEYGNENGCELFIQATTSNKRRENDRGDTVSVSEHVVSENAKPAAYTVHPARYSKGNYLVRCPSRDSYKTRAARLIGDGLHRRWTNREGGYVVTPSKLKKFETLYADGWDASAFTGKLIPPKKEDVTS